MLRDKWTYCIIYLMIVVFGPLVLTMFFPLFKK